MALNAITSTTRRVQFTGDNSTTTFAFTFVIEQASDIAVYFDDTKKTVTTHYTVTVNSDGTGSITTTGGNTPGTGVLVTIIGDRSISRTTEFTAGGPLTAASLENELNSQTLLISQLSERIDRCFTLPIDTDATTPLELPYNNTEASNANRILKFNSAGTAFELGSTTTNIDTLAAIASDITTVSGISSNVTSVAGNSSNINTVAGSISNVNSLGAISSDVATVAGISSNVTTVAGKASLITSDFAADMSLVTSDFVSDMALVTADFISDLNTLATTDIVNDLNLLATSDFVSDLNTLATSDFVSDLNALEAIKADVTSVANNESNINAAVSNASNINSVVSNATNINAVAGDIANVNTVAGNLSGVNSFAERYRVDSSDPTTSLDAGDLAFNTTDSAFKFYDGSSWQTVNVAGIGSVADDNTPQLGGNLDVSGNSIVSVSDGDISITPNGTGDVIIDGLKYPQADGTTGQFLKTDGSGQLAFATVNTDLSNDTSPQLGGDLDLNSNNITGNGNIPAGNLTGALPAIDGSALTGLAAFPSGTKMLFQQTAAPTGWTKDTTNYNDHALRVVTGTVSSGGSSAFSTALATPSVSGSLTGAPASNFSVSISGNIANRTLSVSQIPSHSHQQTKHTVQNSGNLNEHRIRISNFNGNRVATTNTGGNQAHNHGHNLSGNLTGNLTAGNLALGSSTASINVNYVDVIIAAKD